MQCTSTEGDGATALPKALPLHDFVKVQATEAERTRLVSLVGMAGESGL